MCQRSAATTGASFVLRKEKKKFKVGFRISPHGHESKISWAICLLINWKKIMLFFPLEAVEEETLPKHWQHTSFYLFVCDVSSQTERLSNASVPVGAAPPHTDRPQPQHFRHHRRPPSQAETLALPSHLTLCLFAAGHPNIKARTHLVYPNQKCRQPVMSFFLLFFFSISSSKIGTR